MNAPTPRELAESLRTIKAAPEIDRALAHAQFAVTTAEPIFAFLCLQGGGDYVDRQKCEPPWATHVDQFFNVEGQWPPTDWYTGESGTVYIWHEDRYLAADDSDLPVDLIARVVQRIRQEQFAESIRTKPEEFMLPRPKRDAIGKAAAAWHRRG